MIVLTGAKTGKGAKELIQKLKDNEITGGFLHGPGTWKKPHTEYYALDNDCYANSSTPHWWNAIGMPKWFSMLDKIEYPPMFAVLPDVVGNWEHTLFLGRKYKPYLKEKGIRIAIALQDGACLNEAMKLKPDCLFVGGSAEWKWNNVERITEFAKHNRVKIHVGRVNGEEQVCRCLELDVDSCDGTALARFQDKELPRIITAFQGKNK